MRILYETLFNVPFADVRILDESLIPTREISFRRFLILDRFSPPASSQFPSSKRDRRFENRALEKGGKIFAPRKMVPFAGT